MERIAVKRSVWIAAPRERVWQAVTEATQIEQWWGDNWEISALEVGGTVKFYGDGESDADAAYATIQLVNAPHHLIWHWKPNERFPVTTMITDFVLEEENGGTRVTVTESGFESLPEDIRQNRADDTGNGYDIVLGDLKALLEGTAAKTGRGN